MSNRFSEKLEMDLDIKALLGSKIWFVGVEPGGSETSESIKLWLDGKYDNVPPLLTDAYKAMVEHAGWRSFRVDQKIAKVLSTINGNFDDWRTYHENKLYRDGLAYKANLFPLCFPKVKSDEQHDSFIWEEMGIQDIKDKKPAYYELCRKKRFPKWKELLEGCADKDLPKLIIGFGIGEEHNKDFCQAFGVVTPGKRESLADGLPYIQHKGRCGVSILIIPHLSARYFRSNTSLQQMAAFIKGLMSDQ